MAYVRCSETKPGIRQTKQVPLGTQLKNNRYIIKQEMKTRNDL